jgi:hypothetical protein
MAPKRDPRRPPVPTPAPADFLGAKKKKPLSAAAAAKSAGGSQPTRPGSVKSSASATATPASSAAGSSSAPAAAGTSSAPASASGSPSAESRGDKRQRNSSGFNSDVDSKKLREAYDPLASAQPLGTARNPPPSPATSVSTIQSEVTDGGPGPIPDQEVGDELAQIKACINKMDVGALPYGGQVCNLLNCLDK